MSYKFNKMDEISARAILDWRYDSPYDIYNLTSDEVERIVQYMMDP